MRPALGTAQNLGGLIKNANRDELRAQRQLLYSTYGKRTEARGGRGLSVLSKYNKSGVATNTPNCPTRRRPILLYLLCTTGTAI